MPVDLPTLTTARLTLRAWTGADAPVVLDIYSRPEVVRWAGGPGSEIAGLDESRERLVRWERRMCGGAPRGIWAIELTGGAGAGASDVVGSALLVDLPATTPDRSRPPSGDLEIGWHLHPDHWGRGYATEAAQAVLAHAWAGGLERVLAVTHPDNTPSQAVAGRLGMRHEGRSTAYYDTASELFALERPR